MVGTAVGISGCTDPFQSNNDDDVNTEEIEPFESEPLVTSTSSDILEELMPESSASESFGVSVGISDDTILVGAPERKNSKGDDSGGVHVFKNSNKGWEHKNILTTDINNNTYWGRNINISGDTAIIEGRPSRPYIFKRVDGSWEKKGWLTIEGTSLITNIDFNDSGNKIAAISSFRKRVGFVFKKSKEEWKVEDKLEVEDKSIDKRTVDDIAISGDTVFVGTSSKGGSNVPEATYVFERSNEGWSQKSKLNFKDENHNGLGVELEANTAVISSSPTDRAYIFERSDKEWEAKKKYSPGGEFAAFGASVSLENGKALIGADDATVTGEKNIGATYLFERSEDNWPQKAKYITDEKGTRFGMSVDISNDTAVIGGKGEDRGKAYVCKL